MDKKFFDKIIILTSFIVILILVFFVLKPILAILFLSFVLANSFLPMYNFLLKKLKSKGFSAFLVTLFLVIIIILPVLYFTPNLIKEVKNLYISSQKIKISEPIKTILPSKLSEDSLNYLDSQFENVLSKFFSYLFNSFNSFLYSKLPFFIVGFIVFLFLFYYIIQNTKEISNELISIFPIKEDTTKRFASEFENVTNGIIYGQFFLGIIQGILIGLFLYVIKFDSLVFFTFVGIIAGILPLVGLSLVWVPVGLILLVRGQIIIAILLVIYGNFVSWFIDGFMRPYILSEKTTLLNIPLSFIGMVGGAYAFGFLGVIIGPLVIAYLMLIIEYYKRGEIERIFKE